MKIGYLDIVEAGMVSGWAQEGTQAAKVNLYINGELKAAKQISYFRHDLVDSGFVGDAGYAFKLETRLRAGDNIEIKFVSGEPLTGSPKVYSNTAVRLSDEPAAIQCPIFLHIPKTGGSAVHEALARYCPSRLLVDNAASLASCVPQFRQSEPRPRIIYGHLSYGVHNQFGTSPDYVTVLRDPIERIVSCYRYNKVIPQSPYSGTHAFDQSLKAFVESCMTEETNNHMCRIIAGVSNKEGMFIDDEWLLEQAIINLEKDFSVVGTTCNMNMFMQRLSKKLEWDCDAVACKVNVTKGHDLILDRSTALVIKMHNRLDIGLYQYVCDREAETLSS